MDCLNFIFGLRAISTPVETEKQLTRNPGIYNSTQGATQTMANLFNKQSEEEDNPFASLKEQEIHEVIF